MQLAFIARENKRAMTEESARLAHENDLLRMQLQTYIKMPCSQSCWWHQPCGQSWLAPMQPFVDAVSTNAGSSAHSSSECETIALSDDEKEATNLMKNITISYTRQRLVDLLGKHVFRCTYTFVYPPVNFHTSELYGYASVHITCEKAAAQFGLQFAGFTALGIESDLACEVTSSTHMRYRNRPVMHESVDVAWQALLLSVCIGLHRPV